MKRLEHLSQRTLIIGNSGSGKSALSDRLNTLTLVPVVDLDLLLTRHRQQIDDKARDRGPELISAQSTKVIAHLRVEQLLGGGLRSRRSGGHGNDGTGPDSL